MGTNKKEKRGVVREKTDVKAPQSDHKEAYELHSKSKRGKKRR